MISPINSKKGIDIFLIIATINHLMLHKHTPFFINPLSQSLYLLSVIIILYCLRWDD